MNAFSDQWKDILRAAATFNFNFTSPFWRERENGMVKSVADQQFINSSNGFARSPGPTLKEYLFFFFVSFTSSYDELKI